MAEEDIKGRLIGTLKFNNSFNVDAESPLDTRAVVGNVAGLLADSTWEGVSIYNGMTVTIQDTGDIYVLIDKDNKNDLKLGWKQVGSGLGTLVVENYEKAEEAATNDNLGQLVYVKKTTYAISDETGGTIYVDEKPTGVTYTTYSAGAYVVTGSKTLYRLAQSSSGGDISAEVQALQQRMTTAEGDIVDINEDILDIYQKLNDTHTISGDDLEV